MPCATTRRGLEGRGDAWLKRSCCGRRAGRRCCVSSGWKSVRRGRARCGCGRRRSGVNFHDCYVRSGLYQTLKLPGIPGIEAAGRRRGGRGRRVRSASGRPRRLFLAGLWRLCQRAHHSCVGAGAAAGRGWTSGRRQRIMLKGLRTAHMLLHKVHTDRPGRQDPGARGGGRRRPHPVPVGEPQGRGGDRHGRQCGEGRDRAQQGLQARHPVPAAGFRCRRARDHATGGASTSPTIPSARTRSTARSSAWRCWATS